MGGAVKEIQSKEQWDELHEQSKVDDTTIIVDFTATWCGPCRMIGPYFEELSTKYHSLVFVKVDVDQVESVAAACGITAMPTFQVWKHGSKIDEMVGASKEKLKRTVHTNASPEDQKANA